MHNQHKWYEMRDADGRIMYYAYEWSKILWVCHRCGTKIHCVRKPTPKFLKSHGLGRNCLEQACFNILTE